jgi:hypothetical protein
MAPGSLSVRRRTIGLASAGLWVPSDRKRESTMRGAMRSLLGTASLLATLVAGTAPAAAWGSEGHQAVGYVAERFLTAAALAEVRRLIAPAGLPQVASWADEIRASRRYTGAWHFVDTEITAGGYVPAVDCPEGNCAIDAIARYAARMADRSLPLTERQEALKFVVHFVGDVHQPLHACDDKDRGGNDVKVRLAGSDAANLHAVWDNATVAALGPDASTIGNRLVARARALPAAGRAALAKGSPVDWATESWRICRDEIYARLDGGRLQPGGTGDTVLALPDDYATAQAALTEDRLLRAGLRLAALLNAQAAKRR